MDGAGWMERVDGVGSLLQVVRDMMEYDGVKQGCHRPWMNLLFAGSDSCDAGLKEVDCKFMEGKNCTARASAMFDMGESSGGFRLLGCFGNVQL